MHLTLKTVKWSRIIYCWWSFPLCFGTDNPIRFVHQRWPTPLFPFIHRNWLAIIMNRLHCNKPGRKGNKGTFKLWTSTRFFYGCTNWYTLVSTTAQPRQRCNSLKWKIHIKRKTTIPIDFNIQYLTVQSLIILVAKLQKSVARQFRLETLTNRDRIKTKTTIDV